MSLTKEIVVDSLTAMTVKIDPGMLQDNCFADGVPLPRHQALRVCDYIDRTIDEGGFYLMNQLAVSPEGEGGGTIFTLFNKDGDVTNTIRLNFPQIRADRKLPNKTWLKNLMAQYGYNDTSSKRIYLIIESHIRDGGSWTVRINDNNFEFVLRMNDQIKARHEFFKEDITE